MDLVALNVQRGRDHGLPSYVEFRKLCGLSEINSWRQITNLASAPEVNQQDWINHYFNRVNMCCFKTAMPFVRSIA